jgi:hypothetical protein
VLAEQALDELRNNRDFTRRVRAAYEAATPKPKPPTQRTGASKGKGAKALLTPIKDVGIHEINIAAQVDPYFLYDVFGLDQLPLALEEFTKKKLLNEVVPMVQKRNPGAAPNSKADKQGVIAFIVHHVVNG